MSISILNRGGISGGLKPELTVTAPSGSTIDLLQNGIIVATYTLGADETEHTFVVKVGTYTVRGTLEADTTETEVVIDTVGQYAVEIDYFTYLYKLGDECEEITGGWEPPSIKSNYSFDCKNNYATRELLKNSDYLYINASTTSSSQGGMVVASYWTKNAVNMQDVSSLKATANLTFNNSSQPLHVFLCTKNPLTTNVAVDDASIVKEAWFTEQGDSSIDVDVSGLSGMYYVGFGWAAYSAAVRNTKAKIYKAWLE